MLGWLGLGQLGWLGWPCGLVSHSRSLSGMHPSIHIADAWHSKVGRQRTNCFCPFLGHCLQVLMVAPTAFVFNDQAAQVCTGPCSDFSQPTSVTVLCVV